jgi:Integrase zinc binding domain
MDSLAGSRAAATICVEAHCRSAGHRAYEVKLCAIKEYVSWTTMAKDVKVLVQNCLHCVATTPGDKVPRPLGTQLHATKPNEILHFDFPHPHWVVKKREMLALTTSQGLSERIPIAYTVSHGLCCSYCQRTDATDCSVWCRAVMEI